MGLPLLLLKVELWTGLTLDENGPEHILSPAEYLALRKRWTQLAEEHARTCRFHDANMWFRFQHDWAAR